MMRRRRMRPTSLARELRLLVTPALGDWSKVWQLVVLSAVFFVGSSLMLAVAATGAGHVPWELWHARVR